MDSRWYVIFLSILIVKLKKNNSIFEIYLKVQVFYTLGAALILLALFIGLLGVCRDCAMNKLGMPSFLFWLVLASSICQLVGIVVFGAKGIGNYSQYVPDYSIIIASIGLGFSAISAVMFVVEILTYSRFEMKPMPTPLQHQPSSVSPYPPYSPPSPPSRPPKPIRRLNQA